jgi:hypothetical protein
MMTGRIVRMAIVLALSALGFTSSACSPSSCSRGEDATTVDASLDHIVDGVYYSAPYGGPYQAFPGGRTIHFMHGLGKAPLAPVFWLAFSDGAAGDNPALAISAGNEAELVGLDDKEIAVKNDTCSAFYIWFYAEPQP